MNYYLEEENKMSPSLNITFLDFHTFSLVKANIFIHSIKSINGIKNNEK